MFQSHLQALVQVNLFNGSLLMLQLTNFGQFSEPSGAHHHQSMLYFNNGEGVEPSESSSILSELPKLFMGRKKKYNVKKSRSGLFGLF